MLVLQNILIEGCLKWKAIGLLAALTLDVDYRLINPAKTSSALRLVEHHR